MQARPNIVQNPALSFFKVLFKDLLLNFSLYLFKGILFEKVVSFSKAFPLFLLTLLFLLNKLPELGSIVEQGLVKDFELQAIWV